MALTFAPIRISRRPCNLITLTVKLGHAQGAFLQLSGPSRAGPLLLELHGKAPMCRPQQQATAATTNTPSSTTVHAAKVVKTKQDDEVSIAVELASQGSVPAAHLRPAWSHRVMPATY